MSQEKINKNKEKSLEELERDFQFTIEMIGMRRDRISELITEINGNMSAIDVGNSVRELWGEIEGAQILAKSALRLAQKVTQKRMGWPHED